MYGWTCSKTREEKSPSRIARGNRFSNAGLALLLRQQKGEKVPTCSFHFYYDFFT